jgi:hypothetical protein
MIPLLILMVLSQQMTAQAIPPSLLKDSANDLKFPPFIDKETLRFNYPEEINQMSAIFRIETPASDKKVFHYEITAKTANCTMNLGFYISDMKEVSESNSIGVKLRIHDPKGQQIDSLRYKLSDKQEAMAVLKLGTPGRYKFVLTNPNPIDMVIDLTFGLTECHVIKHKIHQNDMIMFTNRFQAYVMKQTVSSLVHHQRQL